MTSSCTGILLAAGQGTRFGANKLLHPLEDGTPMAVASARHLKAALPHSLAVVADAESELAGHLAQEGLQIIENPRAAEGMGTSIACGVAASPEAKGWVIALADMPRIPVVVIRAVAAGLDAGADIIAPDYQGQRGHPVGFTARHGPALMQLDGDAGARGIITANSGSLELIETRDAGVIFDIDNPASLRNL
ncbi:MAG: nucleotidyltransferase family protein [Halobacteria archaeon]|nr:nucleotidyltransferase family protein [Halobacteria archaeon]